MRRAAYIRPRCIVVHIVAAITAVKRGSLTQLATDQRQ
jgi:hypothetical protein